MDSYRVDAGIFVTFAVGFLTGLLTLLSNEVNLLYVGLYCVSIPAVIAAIICYRKRKLKNEIENKVADAVEKATTAQTLALKTPPQKGYGHVELKGCGNYYGEIKGGKATGFGIVYLNDGFDSYFMGEFFNDFAEGYGEYRDKKRKLITRGKWKASAVLENRYHVIKEEFL